METAIEAKLVENIVKSAGIIQKELEPSWASVVTKELDGKFEKIEKVSLDMWNVRKTLEEVKSKADELKEKEKRSLNVILYRFPELDTRDEMIKGDKEFCMEFV